LAGRPGSVRTPWTMDSRLVPTVLTGIFALH
jgi:hypothetical protein